MPTPTFVRRLPALVFALTLVGGSFAASARSITSLADENLKAYYGRYAPHGDCSKGPIISMDASGFAFNVAGQTTHSGRMETMYSYFGNSYQGISFAILPFARDADDWGATTFVINDGEVPGKISVENDGTGTNSAVQRALAKASPFMRCGGAPKIETAQNTPAQPSKPLGWAQLPQAVGDYGGTWDMFHQGEVASAIAAQIGAGRMQALEERLSVRGPLQQQGSLYFVSGNAEHKGGEEQAYIILDAARKRVQVGMWEAGKLTVYAPSSGRLPVPSPIAHMLAASPGENAVALRGLPWELRPIPGRAPAAFVRAAGSQKITSFSIFCSKGEPVLVMHLNRPPDSQPVNSVWNFSGWTVVVPMASANPAGTIWFGNLSQSTLPKELISRKGYAYLRITGDMQGQASLDGASKAVRTALAGCYRF
ncbi:MAG: hypothetical protein ABGW87_03375 [Sphingomonadaceae bacterium]